MKMFEHTTTGSRPRQATRMEEVLFDYCQDAVVTEIEMYPNGDWHMDKIIIRDFRNYQTDSCRTGGNYGYFITYTRKSNGKWYQHFDTTSDLDFCPVTGQFQNCYECQYAADNCPSYQEFENQREVLADVKTYLQGVDTKECEIISFKDWDGNYIFVIQDRWQE